MDDLSFELNAPQNLKSKQTGSRKKFPELSSRARINDKENKKPTKSIKLWDPNEEDIRKFLNKKPTRTTSQQTKSKTVDKLKSGNDGGAKKAVCDFSSQKEAFDKVGNLDKSKKTTVDKVNKGEAVNLKTGNRNIDAKSKGTAKSTHSKGYESSNELSKMSTTYEFSGNSRDESGNLSDDSLVKIFKSKLPTSVKIDRILTPRVNNFRATSTSARTDKGDANPSKSKKLTFDGKDKALAQPKPKVLPSPKPFNPKRITQETCGFRNSVGFNVFATPLKTTHTKISTPTESDTGDHRGNVGKQMKNDCETKHKGKKMHDEAFQSDKGNNMGDVDCGNGGKNGTTKKAPLTCKTNENSENDFDPERNKGNTKEKATRRTKATRIKKSEDLPNENRVKITQKGATKGTQRTPLSPAQNSSLFSTISGGRDSGSNLSGSRNSSLFSSLSPSPRRRNAKSSSLFSTLSMESKESHDSSGSVYVSAAESVTSIDEEMVDTRTKGNKKQLDPKQEAEKKPLEVDRKTCDSRKHGNKKWIESVDTETCEVRDTKTCKTTNVPTRTVKSRIPVASGGGNISSHLTNTKEKVSGVSNQTNNAKDHTSIKDKLLTRTFSPKMLRSRNNTNEKSSLFSSLTSNESLDPTDTKEDAKKQNNSVGTKHESISESRNKSNRRNFSRGSRKENKSSSIISGIDRLNLTEERSNLTEDMPNLTEDKINLTEDMPKLTEDKLNLTEDGSNISEDVDNNDIKSTLLRRKDVKNSSNLGDSRKSRNDENMPPQDIKGSKKPSIHSSLFSSLNSDSSKLADDKPSGGIFQPGTSEVISISSDSSFDIDADLAELEAAKPAEAATAGVLCEASKLSSDMNGGDSKMSEDSRRLGNSKLVEDTKFSEDEMDGMGNRSGRLKCGDNGLAASNEVRSVSRNYANGSSAPDSTLGNMNLTTGVKIRKSKHFFNSSDDRCSSISEPSCVDSSIPMREVNPRRRQLNETIEARDSDVSKSDGSSEISAGVNKVDQGRFHDTYKGTEYEYRNGNTGSLYPKIIESEITDFKTALGDVNSGRAYEPREIGAKSGGHVTKPDPSHSELLSGDKSSWVESSILPKTGASLYPKLDALIDKANFEAGHSNGLTGGAEINRITREVRSQPTFPATKSESRVTRTERAIESTSGGRNVLDDLFDKSKVFNGERWVSKTETGGSFRFKEPVELKDGDKKRNGELDKGEPRADIDLSSWGVNSRGDVKIKVDRYSLSFNFNKLVGPKPETTSTDQLSSDVKRMNDVTKRKSFNRDFRKSIELRRSIVISSDSEEDDSDDQIRVVSKGKRKQRILDSSDEEEFGGGSSEGEGTGEEKAPTTVPKGTRKLLHGLTSEFNEILKINKKATAKAVSGTPKAPPPVRSLDKKPRGKALKQVTPVPNTPLRTDKISKNNNRLTFLSSLSAIIPESYIAHPEAAVYKAKFKSKKEELARRLFHLYNKEVFQDRLPADLPLEWNARMRTTSGFCYNKRTRSADPTQPDVRSARIALSKKILDTADRLRDTLIHELCHAASWLIDGMRDGHGPNWKKWTIYAMQRFPELPPIKRCHDYKIDTKYVYRCSQCDYEFGRHSKSLNVERKVCGYCHGKFVLITRQGPLPGGAEPAAKRPPTQFALFVKENYARVKQDNAGVKHGDVMKLLSQKFAQTKLKHG